MTEESTTAEKPATQRYEIITLIANKYSEEEVGPIVSSITKLIQDNGGTIIAEENWGKRKLAYPIKHFFHAYYHLIECDLPKSSAQKIENALRLDEHLLRHLIVQKRIKSEAELAQEKAAIERIAKQEKTQAETDEAKASSDEATGSRKKKTVDVKALDEKLDKMLDDTQDLL